MSINIKNAEAERLIREYAQKAGVGQTEAVTIAMRQALERIDKRGLAERLMAIGRETAPLFKPPYDTIEHGDLLYDKETGLPK